MSALLKEGWVRKAGGGSYEGNFTPATLQAVEDDLIKDYEGLKTKCDFGRSIDFIVLEFPDNKTSVSIPLQTFEEAGFDLKRAIGRSKKVTQGLSS